MKATVNYLWSIDREIICFNDSEFECPTSIRELKKCENVLIVGKDDPRGPTEVMIDDSIYYVMPVKVSHPSGGGSMYVLEIM